MAARRSILCHQETRKVLRPCFVCMKEGLQERFSLVQMQGQKQGYSTGIQISALWVLGRTPARTALACWTRKGRGQAEIHLSGRADAAAELEARSPSGAKSPPFGDPNPVLQIPETDGSTEKSVYRDVSWGSAPKHQSSSDQA